MTPEREAHLIRIKAAFLREVDRKYREGQREHGGDLFDHTSLWLVEHAMEEALDEYVYLFTLRERLQQMNIEDWLTGNQRKEQLREDRDEFYCHCGRRYEYRWDEASPTGKTMEEV